MNGRSRNLGYLLTAAGLAAGNLAYFSTETASGFSSGDPWWQGQSSSQLAFGMVGQLPGPVLLGLIVATIIGVCLQRAR